MARIMPFRQSQGRGVGFIMATLPMPDGTRRRYRQHRDGRGAFAVIASRWQKDSEKMRDRDI